MKILFCIPAMTKGGAERVMSIIANDMAKENEISIMCLADKKIEYALNNKIKVNALDKNIKYKNKMLINYMRYKILKKYIITYCPDIIISFLPTPSFLSVIAKGNSKVPIIICDRNNPSKEYSSFVKKILMEALYPKANGFVFQTNEQKQFFNKRIQEKSTVIFNPIKDEFLNSDKLIQKENTIISVGRLVEQKNQKLLINAFARISDKYKEYSLKIFGDGPLKTNLQNQIDNLKLNDKVFLCGICDDIKTELEKAKVFVLSSNYEGMPNALIEAMAVGLPVISTDCPCGGPKELIQNEINGILVDVNNEENMANKLDILLSQTQKANRLGKEAEKIKEKLKTENILKQWKDYIKKIYEENKQ